MSVSSNVSMWTTRIAFRHITLTAMLASGMTAFAHPELKEKNPTVTITLVDGSKSQLPVTKSLTIRDIFERVYPGLPFRDEKLVLHRNGKQTIISRKAMKKDPAKDFPIKAGDVIEPFGER